MSLKEFTAAIDAFVVKTDETIAEVLRRVTIVVAENVIVGGEYAPGTPIDTGFARASWWLALNTPTGTPATAGDFAGGQASLDAILLGIPEIKVGDVIYLMNNAEYIEYLEEGRSDQAPSGFIEITVRNGQLIVDKVVAGLPQT